MDGKLTHRATTPSEFAWNEVSGAVGDAVTVVPIVVAVVRYQQCCPEQYSAVAVPVEAMDALLALARACSSTR